MIIGTACEDLLIEDLKWQLTFVSDDSFDFEQFRETLKELEDLRTENLERVI